MQAAFQSRAFLRGWLRDQTHGKLMHPALQLHECRQYFIRAHDETLSVAIRVNNPNGSPFKIQS